MKMCCSECVFEWTLSKANYERCYRSPYCPKCGQSGDYAIYVVE